MEKDSEIYKGKVEMDKSIVLKAKKESSDDETSTSSSEDKKYAMEVRGFKKFFRRNDRFVRQPRHKKKSFWKRDEKKGNKLRLENDKLKESQDKLVNDASKFMKFEQSSNSLKEMLNAQRLPNSKATMEMERDIEKITLEEYLRYESKKESRIWKSVRSKGRTTRSKEQEEVQNVCDDNKFRDTDQEDGDLLDFPIFLVTNVFASVCEHVEENINASIAFEKKEVHMGDIKIDENPDVDHLKTK
ncbi:hypothetical protein Tco_1362821 [Tanacetum coccineum]